MEMSGGIRLRTERSTREGLGLRRISFSKAAFPSPTEHRNKEQKKNRLRETNNRVPTTKTNKLQISEMYKSNKKGWDYNIYIFLKFLNILELNVATLREIRLQVFSLQISMKDILDLKKMLNIRITETSSKHLKHSQSLKTEWFMMLKLYSLIHQCDQNCTSAVMDV